ncbi:MAG: PIN domain-containing protein [Ruminococcus sp.]|nr:PIN domain-containing protein [Ruminococcus sp.]
MAVFLVDFENVHSTGLLGVDQLTEKDSVYIFYSVNSNSMSFEAYKMLNESKAKITVLSASCGIKNALDFQLSSFVGYIAGTSDDKDIYIISADKGYACVQIFWDRTMKRNDLRIRFAVNIRRCLQAETAAVQPGQGVKINYQTAAAFLKQPVYGTPVVKTAAADGNGEAASPLPAPALPPAETDTANENAHEGEAEVAAVNETEEISEGEKAVTTEITPINEAEVTEKLEADRIERDNENAEEPSVSSQPDETEESESENESTDYAGLIAAGIDEQYAANIYSLIEQVQNKKQLYVKLISTYGMKGGIELYKAARSEYDNIKKTLSEQSDPVRDFHDQMTVLLGKAKITNVSIDEMCIIIACSSDRQQFHTKLMQSVGADKCRTLYKPISSEFDSLKALVFAYTDMTEPCANHLSDLCKKSGLQNADVDEICRQIADSKDKQQFYTRMTSFYGQSTGLKLYKAVRTEYDSLKYLLAADRRG